MMKKVVIKLDINGTKQTQKAMKAVSSLQGIESISMDPRAKKLIVVGDVDAVDIVARLKNSWRPEIVSVGPAKDWDRVGAGGAYKSGEGDIGRLGMEHNARIWKLNSDPFYNPSYLPQYYPRYNTMDDTTSCNVM